MKFPLCYVLLLIIPVFNKISWNRPCIGSDFGSTFTLAYQPFNIFKKLVSGPVQTYFCNKVLVPKWLLLSCLQHVETTLVLGDFLILKGVIGQLFLVKWPSTKARLKVR